MSPFAILDLLIVWFALIAYAVFGGADFGGGIWDLLARGPRADKQRQAISLALGPVWEVNNVWIIFVLVGTWTAFPFVFSAISTALFIPLTLALLGIVLRGAAFVFRAYLPASERVHNIWGNVFSAASTITPFVFGMCAAAIASGGIRVQGGIVRSDPLSPWTTPFAFTCGIFALSLCACLAATYLTVEARNQRDEALLLDFRLRALGAGAIAALAGGIALLLARTEAPYLWDGLTSRGLPLTLSAMVIGLATAWMLIIEDYRIARILLIFEVAAIFAAWGFAQSPYLIVPDVDIAAAASAESTLRAFFISSIVGMLLLFPSIALLFAIFKGKNPGISHP